MENTLRKEELKPEKQSLEIGIIGGPFDRITTVLNEFEPGQKDFIRPLESFGVEPRSVTEVVEREVEIKVPARLHPTVLDMNRFNLNRAGGGGIPGRAGRDRGPMIVRDAVGTVTASAD